MGTGKPPSGQSRVKVGASIKKGEGGRKSARGLKPRESAQPASVELDEFFILLKSWERSKQFKALRDVLASPDIRPEARRLALISARDVLNQPMRGRHADALEDFLKALSTLKVPKEDVPLIFEIIELVLRRTDGGDSSRWITIAKKALREMLIGHAGDAPHDLTPNLLLKSIEKFKESTDEESALPIVRIAVLLFPYDKRILETALELFEKLELSGDALNTIKTLHSLYPRIPRYHLKCSERLLRDEKETETALRLLNAYLKRFPSSSKALSLKLDALFALDRIEDANSLADFAVSKHPKNANFYCKRAVFREIMGQFKLAQEDYKRARELDPKGKYLLASSLRRYPTRPPAFFLEEMEESYNAFLTEDLGRTTLDTRPEKQSFSDICGLDDVIEILRQTIEYPLKYPELSKRYGKHVGGRVLLYGPPGCGKTMLARALATETNCAFISVSLSTILDKWVGNTEKAISAVFQEARKNIPSIVFVDEIDALGRSRDKYRAGWEVSQVSQLLVELDGIQGRNDEVFVLTATNAPWNVDLALRRSGRLGKLVYVPPPDAQARAQIFSLYLARKRFVSDDIDVVDLARRTDQYSPDAIRGVVEEASGFPWLSAIRGEKPRPICQADLIRALEKVSPDLSEWQREISEYEEFKRHARLYTKIGFPK